MRRAPYPQFHVHFRTRDRIVLEDLVRLTGLASEADVIRLALQRLADHYELDGKAFAFRGRRDPRKVKASAA